MRRSAVSWSSRAGNVVRMGGCKSLSDVGVWSKERRACGVCRVQCAVPVGLLAKRRGEGRRAGVGFSLALGARCRVAEQSQQSGAAGEAEGPERSAWSVSEVGSRRRAIVQFRKLATDRCFFKIEQCETRNVAACFGDNSSRSSDRPASPQWAGCMAASA